MYYRQHVARLRESSPVILPSLLLCDFGNLEREVARLTEAGVLGLHLDVMDGDFVPNFTYGLPIVSALRRLTDLPLDVHLMISHPERYLRHFREAGADILTIHVEAVSDPRPLLIQIRELGAGAGLAFNPKTPLAQVEKCLDLIDVALVMSVEAGFGGQSFDRVALEKLRRLREIGPRDLLLEIDGGVNQSTIHECAAAGAQLFVVGSALFRSANYTAAVRELAALAVA